MECGLGYNVNEYTKWLGFRELKLKKLKTEIQI